MLRQIARVTVLTLLFSLAAMGQQRSVESFEGREVASGEILVRFRNAGGPQAQALAAQDGDIVSSEQVGRSGVVRLKSRGRRVDALLRAYRQRFDVVYAEPNYIWHATDFPNDEFAGQQWALKNTGQEIQGQIGMPGADVGLVPAWNVTEGSRGIVVGVVDSGIDYNHPDLAANVWSAPAAFSVTIGGQVIDCAAGTHGFDAILRTCDPQDDDGHGTHVAGIIGAAGNNGLGVSGVNRIASIMALKFLAPFGGTTSDAIAAIDFAIQVKAIFPATANIRVLNNSWDGSSFSQALMDEVSLANANDMLFVVAAGNALYGNPPLNNDLVPDYPASLKVPNVVAVAATDNQDRLADFSNWGPSTVHLGAPGVDILSTVPQGPYEYFSGTSMAAPMVSGAAALVLSVCPLTTAGLKSALLNSTDHVVSLEGRTITGGRLNIARAISSCVTTSTGFGLTVSPGIQQLELMQPSTFTVTVAGTNGFSAPVGLSLLDVPAGMTAEFTSSSVFGDSGTSTLTLTASNVVEAGTYMIGVLGTSGAIQRVSGVAVTVGFPINPGETIAGELTSHDAPSPEAPDKYQDLYKLTVTSTTAVTIDLKSRVFDPFLYVRSSTRGVFLSDDNGGSHNNSRVQATLAPGTYSIEVTTREFSDLGPYTLSINTPTLRDIVPYLAAPGSTVSVTLAGNRFASPMTVDAGSGITVNSVNVVNSTLASATLTVAADAAATPRELTVRTNEGVSNPLTLAVPLSISTGQRITGILSSTDPTLTHGSLYRYTDLYQLQLTAQTAVTIDMTSDQFDAHLYLLSSNGSALFEDDNSGSAKNARISVTLAAGTYFVEATSSNSLDGGIYDISVNMPTLDWISPNFLGAGDTSTLMTLTGNRLSGVLAIDAGSGITVSNISKTNSTITASFTVAAGVITGNRSIRVTTSEGVSNAVRLLITPAVTTIAISNVGSGTAGGTLTSTDSDSVALPGSHADFYRFTLTSPAGVTISLEATEFEGYLALLSASGDVINEGGDFLGTGVTQLATGLGSGTYFIEVTSRDSSAKGDYALGLNTGFDPVMSPAFAVQGTSVDVTFTAFPGNPVTLDAGPGITVNNLSFTTFNANPSIFGPPKTLLRVTATLEIPVTANPGTRLVKLRAGTRTDAYPFTVMLPFIAITQGQTIAGSLSGSDQASLSHFGTYGDFYSIVVGAGTATLVVTSEDFSVSLSEVSPSGDVGGHSQGFEARLTGLSVGVHLVEVTSTSPAIGTYALSFLPPPTLTSIAPASAAAGTPFGLVLTGTDFTSPMSISASPNLTFGKVTVYGPTLATVIVTSSGGAGIENISVRTDAGTSSPFPINLLASGSNASPSASRLNFARFFSPAELPGTGIAVLNPSSVPAEVQFRRYSDTGILIGYYAETVGARSQWSRLGSLLFPDATQSGWIEVSSTVAGLTGFWFVGDFTNVMDGSESAPSARELVFPLVTPTTELTLVSSTLNAATIRIYDAGGTEMTGAVNIGIPPNGGVQYSVAQLFPFINLNNAKYICVAGTSDLMGSTLIKDFPVAPSYVVLNGADSSTLSTEVNFPHVPTGGNPAWLSIAGITNLSTSPQTVTFTFTQNSGSSVSVTRQLPGRGSIRESVDDLLGFAGSFQNGWMKVTGTLPLTGYIVYGYATTGGAAAVPVQTMPRTEMVFSHVANGPLWGTGMALLNATTRDANVEVYIMRPNGALLGGAADVQTAAFILKAGTKSADLLDALVPASVFDGGFVYVRSTNDVSLYGLELFFTREVKVIANVPAGLLAPGVGYTPPPPSNPLPPMTISSVNPPAVAPGTAITLTGLGFDPTAANNTVVFRTATASVSVPATAVTASTLTVDVPPSAVTGPVYFVVGARFSNSIALTVQ